MANPRTGRAYQAVEDANKNSSILFVSGTVGSSDVNGTAEVVRGGANPNTGAQYVETLGGPSSLTPFSYDNLTVTYPTGTTEIYAYRAGTSPLGTVTTTYTDTSKANISTVVLTKP